MLQILINEHKLLLLSKEDFFEILGKKMGIISFHKFYFVHSGIISKNLFL